VNAFFGEFSRLSVTYMGIPVIGILGGCPAMTVQTLEVAAGCKHSVTCWCGQVKVGRGNKGQGHSADACFSFQSVCPTSVFAKVAASQVVQKIRVRHQIFFFLKTPSVIILQDYFLASR
jgi:hypothetical protein